MQKTQENYVYLRFSLFVKFHSRYNAVYVKIDFTNFEIKEIKIIIKSLLSLFNNAIYFFEVL